MDRLRSIEIFIQVAQGLSFSSAAQRLGIAKSNVTRHVGWLEKSLGVQLLARTTKSVRLTKAGLSLFENGQNSLEMVERIERDLQLSTNELKGTLRVGTPPSFGTHHLVPVITAFADACLERCGIPRSIPELAHHDCMVHSLKSPTNVWSFTGPDGNVSVRARTFLDFLKAGFENAQWAAKPAQERGASAARDKSNGRIKQDKR